MTKLKASDAIEFKRANPDSVLCKYADPTEEELKDISIDFAEDVLREDPGLIYLDTDDIGGAK